MDEWFISKQVSTLFVFDQPLPISLSSHRNIRCLMAYIVDLTVILHGLFRTSHSVSATVVQSAMKDYANLKTGARRQIHMEIRSFVTQIPFTYHEKDTIMEKTIDLINQNCVPTGGG